MKGDVFIAKSQKKEPIKRMTKEEIESFNNLYEYVRTNILGYDKNQALSSQTVLRLKGLKVNKFAENYREADSANYSFDVILNTFKYCSPNIQRGLRGKVFKNESHKINYIFKIVEANLNDVYLRMKNAEKQKSEIDKIDVKKINSYKNHFTPRPNRRPLKGLEDLW